MDMKGGFREQRCSGAPGIQRHATPFPAIFATPMLPDPQPFLHQLFEALDRHRIPVDHLQLDHLCYRVADLGRYTTMKQVLAEQGSLLAESTIGGRHIATYRLHLPIVRGKRHIALVELPAPKADSPYPEGWEHAEFVVPGSLLAFTQEHPHPDWDLRALDKAINADVRLPLGAISVKFHQRALDVVIAEEERSAGENLPR